MKYVDNSEVLIVAESESGICGSIEMAPYENSVDWEEKILVAFEKGYMEIELPAPLQRQEAGKVMIMKDNDQDKPPVKIKPSLPKVSAMKNQAKNFISALKGEKEVPCNSKQALEDLKLARDYIGLTD